MVFIGDAVLVDGARPDVETLYPTYPFDYRAGWGYMLLTYGLPNQGNGTFTLYAYAADAEGNTTLLGQKTVNGDNTGAVKPFGAIDTPTQGGTASGASYVNFAWALTPQPSSIPVDGSTITVWVDGVPLGHPVYNVYRSDIASLFPGTNNSNGAGGYFHLDTTAYANGVHTIAWSVIDNNGNQDGIGSRFFSILNTTSSDANAVDSQSSESLPPQDIAAYPYSFETSGTLPATSMKQINGNDSTILNTYRARILTGVDALTIKELENIILQVAEPRFSSLRGYMQVGDRLAPLPVGSTLDMQRGLFYWYPGPGFRGSYRLVFLIENQDGQYLRKFIDITIEPR